MTDPVSLLGPYLTPTRDPRFRAAVDLALAWQAGQDGEPDDQASFDDRLSVARYLAGRLAVPPADLGGLQPALTALFELARSDGA